MKRLLLAAAVLMAISMDMPGAGPEAFFVTQTGEPAGVCTARVHNEAWLEDAANYGSGGDKIGPDDSVYLCGAWRWPALSDGLHLRLDASGGKAGHPIRVHFTNATFSSPAFNTFGVKADFTSYVVFDGGTSIIENTENGSELAYHHNDGIALNLNHCDHCEAYHFSVRNMYQHTRVTDHCCALSGVVYSGEGFLLHDNVAHDDGVEFDFRDNSGYRDGGPDNIRFYRNAMYNYTWGISCSESSGHTLGHFYVYENHFGGTANWDTDNDQFHKNAMHCYGAPPNKIQNIYIYNNLVDGDWGKCCITSIGFFLESSDTAWGDATSTAYIFNNLFTPRAGIGVSNGYINVGTGTNLLIVNNTAIGLDRRSGDILHLAPCCGSPVATRVRIQNNILAGGDHVVLTYPGMTFAAFDRNVYGNSANMGSHAGTEYSTPSTWRAACSCDANSLFALAGPLANLSATGVPSPAFVGAGIGANLSNLCSGELTALCADYLGNPRTGPWTVGALQVAPGGDAGENPGANTRRTPASDSSKSPKPPTLQR